MEFNLEILNNPKEKEELAIKMFNESSNNVWEYYRRFIRLYGLDVLLKLYDGKVLQKIIDKNGVYIILGSMLENDVDRVLEYALTDNDFLEILSKKGIDYYSLLCNIDYKLIKEYLKKHSDIVVKLFLLSSEEYTKLLNDSEISDDIKCQLIGKCYDKEVLSNYFTNNKKSINIFNKLSENAIQKLINNKVSFKREILMSEHMFDACKTSSLINFRKRINNLAFHSGNIDIEKKVYDYYIDLLKDYNPVTKLFHQYEKLDEIKGKYYDKNDYIVNGDVLYHKTDLEYLKSVTSKKISEIVVDYLFKDNIYNVFINIRELLSYNESLNNKLLDKEIMSFYELILNIDKMDNDNKINLFFKLKDKKIDEMFYDDLNRLKKDSYQKITNSLVKTKDSEKDKELSTMYHTTVYDYREKDFFMLVRTMGSEFREYTRHRRDCYSLISNNHTIVFNPNDYIYGYGNVAIKDIMHVYEHDAYSSNINNNGTTNYINRIYSPEELINSSIGINEIQILNKKDDLSYLALKPTYIIALNEVTEKVVLESKRLNIPIILIKSKKLTNDMVNEGNIRIKTEPFQLFGSIDNYVDKELDYNEEEKRSSKR